MTPPVYSAFFAAIQHKHIESVQEILLEYGSCTKWLIAMEISPTAHQEIGGQHMHFITNMTSSDYALFTKRVFIKQYNLRGRASKDMPRQYGKLKVIHDIDKMFAYTIKDNNIRTNFSVECLAEWKKHSYKKQESQVLEEKLHRAIHNAFVNNPDKATPQESLWDHLDMMQKFILEFYLNENVKVSRFAIRHAMQHYMTLHISKTKMHNIPHPFYYEIQHLYSFLNI